jgi:hypothetical protein
MMEDAPLEIFQKTHSPLLKIPKCLSRRLRDPQAHLTSRADPKPSDSRTLPAMTVDSAQTVV